MTVDDTYAKAMELYQQRQFDAAERLLASLTDDHPERGDAWQLRAGVASAQGNFVNGIKFIQNALERLAEDDPSRPVCLANCGVLLFRAERFDEAEQTLREAVAKAPELANAMGTLIQCLGKTGQADEALQFANQFVSQSPLDADRWALLAASEAEAGNQSVYAQGISAFQQGTLKEAVRYLSHTAAAAPEDVRYAFDECAAATQFGRWNGKETELPELLARFEERATPATLGVYRLFASAALFRLSAASEADRMLKLAREAMMAAGNWDDVRFADNEASVRLGSHLEKPDVPQRSATDPYADSTQAEVVYSEIRNQTQRSYPFEHETALTARIFSSLLRGFLTEKSDIQAVTQLGTSCANLLQSVAREFSGISFTGVERSAKFTSLNELTFPADNIRYAASDYLGFMSASTPVENGLLLHTQALALEYPEVVREIYRLARDKGYKYVAMLEPVGFDRQQLRYPTFAKGFQSFVCRDHWMVHDYSAMLIQAAYKIEHTTLYPMACGLAPMARADLHLFHALAVLR